MSGKKTKRVRQPWGVLRDKFIRLRLDGETLTLAQFAKENGVHRRTVERHASREGWFSEIERRAQDQQRAIDAHSVRVVERLQRGLNIDEVEVRGRHALAMKNLIRLAEKKLEELNPEDLSIEDLIGILRFAPREERSALGLPEKCTNFEVSRQFISEAFEKFENAMQQRQKLAIALTELTSIVEGPTKDGVDDEGSDS